MATLEIDGTLFAEKDVNGNVVTVANTSTVSNLDVTTVMTLPKSATDPVNPVAGQIYYNTTDNIVKHYDGTNWVKISTKFEASGGTETTSNGYKYHTFTTSNALTVVGTGEIEYLMVAGGGGGGRGEANPGGDGAGGGGAGGYIVGNAFLVSGSYQILIGEGGPGSSDIASKGTNGDNTTFNGLTAIGGGGGGSDNGTVNIGAGSAGGSGGGAANVYNTNTTASGGAGTTGQGFKGGDAYGLTSNRAGAGGGGATSAGSNVNSTSGGDGGTGYYWSVNGTYYSGGGGGGSVGSAGGAGAGGAGGGGAGGDKNSSTPVNGTANTGGGGGGGSGYGTTYPTSSIYSTGANGGSGIVIIRYAV